MIINYFLNREIPKLKRRIHMKLMNCLHYVCTSESKTTFSILYCSIILISKLKMFPYGNDSKIKVKTLPVLPNYHVVNCFIHFL